MKEMTVKQFASKGGKARAQKLSKERRKEISMMGVKARMANKKLSPTKKLSRKIIKKV